MTVQINFILHGGGEYEDVEGTSTSCLTAQQPLTLRSLKQVFPFKGEFHFRLKRVVSSRTHAHGARDYMWVVSIPPRGLGFHKNVDYISPDLNHTGIRTAFQEKVARPVKPNGRLTYDYKVNAYTKVATPSRALAKLEKNKIRAHYVKNSTYEERLMSLDQKRSALGSACQRQLEQETQFLVPAESLEGSSVLSGQSKKSTNRRKQKHIRPRKIVNQRSIVDLLIDTSEMSICSSAMVPVLTMEDDECTHSASRFSPEQDAGAESVCTLGSSNTLRSTASGLQLKGGAVLSKTEHWDADALRKVYGDDLLLDSVEQQDMSDEAPSS